MSKPDIAKLIHLIVSCLTIVLVVLFYCPIRLDYVKHEGYTNWFLKDVARNDFRRN